MVSRPICTRPSRRRDGGPLRERSPRSIVLVGRPARSIALAWGSIANENKHASHRQIFDREYCCRLRNVRIRFALVRHKLSFDRPPAHAKIPSHWSPSVERFRIHVKGMVRSAGWLDGFPEVGRRGGPWRRRRAKDLLDASAEGRKQFVAARCSVPKTMQKPQSRGGEIIAMNRWPEILRSGADRRSWRRTRASARHDPVCRYRPVHRKSRAARRFALDTGDESLLRRGP